LSSKIRAHDKYAPHFHLCKVSYRISYFKTKTYVLLVFKRLLYLKPISQAHDKSNAVILLVFGFMFKSIAVFLSVFFNFS